MDPKTSQNSDGIKRRLRRKRQKMVAVALMEDFAQNSTLHGLRYITERGLSIVEKLFWLAAVVISFSLCAMLIWKVWTKWQMSPVLVTLNEKLVSVGEVPFPSITICQQNKVKQSVFNDSTFAAMKKLRIINDTDEYEMFEHVALLCKFGWSIRRNNFSDPKIIEDIIKVAPTSKDIFYSCLEGTKWIKCSTYFKPVLTSEGLCFTMNTLAATEIFRVNNVPHYNSYLMTTNVSRGWSHSEGYTTTDGDTYPLRGRGQSGNPDFGIILHQDPAERSKLCNSYNKGFKIYLHHPADMPQSSVYYYSVVDGETLSLALKMSVLNTSTTLKDYPPQTRQCYFPDEGHLKYFLAYTADNCRLECMSNYTYNSCGCVWFNMPHNDNSTICGSNRMTCVTRAIESFAMKEGFPDTEIARCRCLPLCNNIKYEAEVLHSKFDRVRYMESRNLTTSSSFLLKLINSMAAREKKLNFSRIELYFKESQFVSMRRSELFGLPDFLANCGGLLGLFLGFSFLSLVEIAYFVTLRLGCSIRRNNKVADSTTGQNKNAIEP